MKTAFITTVLNEEREIVSFLDSLQKQTELPDEIVIVDAGSKDKTCKFIREHSINKKRKIKLITNKGNRSVGRNTAIRAVLSDIIAVSDVGCILDKNWFAKIVEPFKDRFVSVVSGFYHPKASSIFERSLSAYTCVMPGKLDKDNFLPASRSVAFKKSAWQKVGGYPENLDTCEDLVFAKKLKKADFKFVFREDAKVLWPQRKNIIEAFGQFFAYAVGDGEARYFRPQTPLLFVRYIVGLSLIVLYFDTRSYYLLLTIYYLLFFYIAWSIWKNFRYVKKWQALFILPILQIISDIAVISGTSIGLIRSFYKK